MCDCISSSLPPHSSIRLQPPSKSATLGFQFIRTRSSIVPRKSPNSIKVSRDSRGSRSSEHDFHTELLLEERGKPRTELDTGSGNGDEETNNFLEFDENSGGERLKDEDLVKIKGSEENIDLKLEELGKSNTNVLRRGRQLMKRSNMIAKQVISMESALSLGFVSQLWVDTNSWIVFVVEVRPNLLSGELERFLLEDTSQVGDVVLIPDESVMENDFKLVGLETLVGYSVVTPGRRNIGKVRGYTFNINSGAIESLELDSFGISIIPSSLVSTYALFVEDVLEVVSDTVVVHEAAASRIQRLTKGFWDAQKTGFSMDDLGGYSDQERQPAQSVYRKGRRRRSTKSQPRMRDGIEDDWELPMDYL